MSELKVVRMTEDVDRIAVVATFSTGTDLTSVPCTFGMRKRGEAERVLDYVGANKEDVTDTDAGEAAQTRWRLYYDFTPEERGDYEGHYLGRFQLDYGADEPRSYPEDGMLAISFRRGV
jgi:hypothetical protein